MEIKNPIEEARRYVANAEEIIKKANYDPELNIYTDNKYVKAGGCQKGAKKKYDAKNCKCFFIFVASAIPSTRQALRQS